MLTSDSNIMSSPRKERKSDKEKCSIDDVPFSVLAKLFCNLRNTRSKAGRGGKGFARGGSIRENDESRPNVLMRGWFEICKHVKHNDELLKSRLLKKTATHGDGTEELVPAHFLSPEDAVKVVSLIIPDLDAAHPSLGMKEPKLADAFIRALDLVPGGEDALWLKNYKEHAYRPKRWKNDATVRDGDFPSVLRAVLGKRCRSPQQGSLLTIGIVWNVLDLLAQSTTIRNKRFRRGDYGTASDEQDGANKDKDIDEGFVDSRHRAARGGITGKEDEKRSHALITLVENGTAVEVAEVTRIILKEMNMSLSRDYFLSWFHPDAKQHYTQVHDVKRMLEDCHNPDFDIGEPSVQLGQYASVMLTMRPSRKNLSSICEKLRGGIPSLDEQKRMASTILDYKNDQAKPYFMMEPKLDGERLQLHKWKVVKEEEDKNEFEEKKDDRYDEDECRQQKKFRVKTFTRNGLDSSGMYSNALEEVIIKGVRARDVILDGEITVWDDRKKTWIRFEHMREVTTAIADKRAPDGKSYILRYVVFDVLFVNQGRKPKKNESSKSANMVMRMSLQTRRKILEKLIPEKVERDYGPGVRVVVELIDMEPGHSEQELTNALQRYETLGYEGVIAKHPDRPYVLAERSHDLSIKLKPDYFDGGIQDIDVLILGAKYSGSKGHRAQRAGKLSSFLIGVRTGDDETGKGEDMDNGGMEKWVPIACVGTGYSDKDLEKIQEKLEGDWLEFDKRDLPDHFVRKSYPSTVLGDIAKWIQPYKSIVVTVQAYELNHKYDILRFPRMKTIRWDKAYDDVITFGHLKDLDEHKLPAFVQADNTDADDTTASYNDGNDNDAGVFKRKRKRRSGMDPDSDEEVAMKIAREEGHEISGGKRGGRLVIGGAEAADVSRVDVESDILDGLTFMVVIERDDLSAEDVNRRKKQMEILIHRLGGTFVQNVTRTIDYIICENGAGPRVRRWCQLASSNSRPVASASAGRGGGRRVSTSSSMSSMSSLTSAAAAQQVQKWSIVLDAWVHACEKEQARVDIEPQWVVAANEALQKRIYRQVDRFGDAWHKDADMTSFLKSLSKVDQVFSVQSGGAEDREDDDEDDVARLLDRCDTECGLVFKGLVMVVDSGEGGAQCDGCVALFEAFGGSVVNTMCGAVTHSLCHDGSVEGGFHRVQDERDVLAGRAPGSVQCRIKRVNKDWVIKCVDASRLVD